MTCLIPRSELALRSDRLRGWVLDGARNALYRQLIFATFGEALAAMVRIGMEADKAGHHPEWSNVDNRLDIWLTTHDIDGISDRDLALANVINSMFPAERTPDQAGYEALSTGWVRY